MSYILGITAIAVLFVILHNFTELGSREKILTTLTLLGVVLSMYLYNLYTDLQRDHVTEVVLKYKQNKTLTCKGIEINSTNFSYSVGTQTFIGREKSQHYGRLISATECK